MTSASRARAVGVIVNRGWARLPPLWQRTFRDDLKWMLGVLTGVAAGFLMFGQGDPSPLVGALFGVAVVLIVLDVLRRMKHGRKARTPRRGA